MNLVTLKQFEQFSAKAKGYISYMQGNLPGSELKEHQGNPYLEHTKEHAWFEMGQRMAILEAQDDED